MISKAEQQTEMILKEMELTTMEILDQLNESIEENNKVLDELKEVLARQV